MAKILVDLPDAEREGVDFLVTSALATTVSNDYPSATLGTSATHLQVDLENSDTGRFPVAERAQLRVTAHAAPGKRTVVKELAADAYAYLCSRTGNANVAGIVPIAGRSGVSTDPATKNVMCWVLVGMDLLATTVAS